MANLTRNPAMSVPFGFDAQGLPVGIHLLGRYGEEGMLFRLAAQLEVAAPWADRHPDHVPATKATAAAAEDDPITRITIGVRDRTSDMEQNVRVSLENLDRIGEG